MGSEIQKQKIREKYKGLSPDKVEVIAAKEKFDFYDSEIHRRVAVYVRVSTDNLQQTSSYELQKNYYENKVLKNKNWTLVGIYADEGISGTSLKHRDEFNRMISDCEDGKIDLIITKSVSRFSRNTVDGIDTVRKLALLKSPVGVFFETESLFTLDENSHLSLNFLISMAEEESHIKSSAMNASIEMRFSHGILLTPVLLGYDHDSDGNLIVNEDEAKTVRLIFFMYLFGYGTQKICDTLTGLSRKTKKGNTEWSKGSIIEILKNERYCGDVLARKTFTPNYLDHKSKKNKGDRTQYKWFDHHEPIVSRDDYIAVQHLIANAKYGNRGLLPHLSVINSGALKGFVQINPRWAGFNESDYISVCEGVYDDSDPLEPNIIHAKAGDFDYRQFMVVRTQFFNTAKRICVTLSVKDIIFSTPCLSIIEDMNYVELYFHPQKLLFGVKSSNSEEKNAVKWAKTNRKGSLTPRKIGASAYAKTIFKILGWNEQYRYRVRGFSVETQEGENMVIFDLYHTEKCISLKNRRSSLCPDNSIHYQYGQNMVSLERDKFENFGDMYYSQNHFNSMSNDTILSEPDKIIHTDMRGLNLTGTENLRKSIDTIIGDIKGDK